MRQLFDQYDEPENRLTHALVCCLAEDRRLLRDFVGWATGRRPPRMKRLHIVEQTLPGEDELPEDEAEKKGLPDAWVHDDEHWSLIVESKISSPVQAAQLRRHRRTAVRRGFTDQELLVLSPGKPSPRSLAGAHHRTWSEVYTWLSKQNGKSAWAVRMLEYMGVAEERMTATGYLKEGTLTRFSGFPFDADNPWNYREAKRILRLALDELRKNKPLQRIGMDPKGQGRPAITGQAGAAVWDFLPLTQGKKAKRFTEFPHLTLAIQRVRVLVMVTVPNGIRREFRNNLLDLGEDGFCGLISGIAADVSKRLQKAKGAKPWMDVVQRHFLSQKSAAIEDARLEFDLRTGLDKSNKKGKADKAVKNQPQWLRATFDAWSNKDSNLQIGVGAIFPCACPVLRSREALRYIAETWLACEPLIETALGRKSSR